MNISLSQAKQIIEAAAKRAVAMNKPITVAVVDAGGYLVALERMDGARPIQPQIANAKAYTGAIMQRPGLMLKGWQDSQPGFFAQLSTMGLHPILAAEGALPIKRDGELIGGLGVAGGTGPEDQHLCESVLRELGYELDFDQFNSIIKKAE
jgi:uncharacterized protein GlcG (DUF336 family)